MGWIGVDFDGTLAKDSDSTPVPAMLERVKRWLKAGIEVRILTARVSLQTRGECQVAQEIQYIDEWCLKYLGHTLPITCEKDRAMYQLWDDRAVQVIKDTGERVGNVNRPANRYVGATVIDEETGFLR